MLVAALKNIALFLAILAAVLIAVFALLMIAALEGVNC
jgi:hypothetical protein